MSDHPQKDEQIFSTTSEPVVEFIEEVQEDGSVIRKKKTTRKITKRILTTTTSVKEEEPDRQQQQLEQQQHHQHDIIATFESSESTLKDLSVGSASITEGPIYDGVHPTNTTSTTETVAITSSTSATAVSSASSETIESDEVSEKSSSTTNTTTTTTSTEQSKRTFKYGFFGKGNADDHPFYKFLARFPLKQSPAPHTRPRPVKPTIYAFAPGWKVGGGSAQENQKQESKDKEVETEKEKEPIVGSFDVDSLKWMAYLKFNQIDYDIRPAFEPTMSPSGKLPFLALPNGSLITEDGFEQWVQENKGQSDEDKASAALNIHEAAEAVAFSTLAESKIHAALLYTLWFEAPHFHGTTRQHYFGHHNYYLGKLLNYISKSNIVHSMLLTRTQIDRELIFEEASAAIEALSVQLGSNEYFFGKSIPSSLDAIVFSYLHVILTLPRIQNAEDSGRSGELARMVRKHENLFKYSQNIWKKSFAA
ncbi:hypothetical protein BGZ95_011524 [Linnemannia exigua]|uniref:Metaxin glutathione S-transferase domain-containing protein n=1 Tax=Linnemannia exigua TaxID=604196 RepID=A0AAD4D9T9_9FUNG|nr:hypothetical protein BGZ95_011524 [Linnemannia exigua]